MLKSTLIALTMLTTVPAFAGEPSHNGPPGPPGKTGPQGPAGPQGPMGLPGMDGQQGIPGMPGVAGAQGPQGVPGLDARNGAALAAAMSMPVWLERQENFAVSGGFGFDQYTPAFGGAAVDTQYGTWAGKVGGRVGW